MPSNWYYTRDGSRVGPVAGAELKRLARSGGLAPTDQVWKEGMAKWQPAGQVKGLFDAPPEPVRASHPPPLPDTPDDSIPVGDGRGRFGGNSTRLTVLLGVGLVVSLGLTLIVPALLGDSRSKSHDWFVPAQELEAQRRREAPASLALAFFLFLDMGLALALGLTLFDRHRGQAADPARTPEPAWLWLWHRKPALFGLAFVWLLLPSGGVSALTDVLPDALGTVIGGGYTLLMVALFVALVVFTLRSLLRGVEADARRLSLCGRWEPVDPADTPLELTDDGAIILGDGTAGRYVVADSSIRVEVEGRPPETWAVLTVSRHELVVTAGGRSERYRKGLTYSEMQAKQTPGLLASLFGGGNAASEPATGGTAADCDTAPARKREPGLWHRLRSAFNPKTNPCPHCHENLAGEGEGTELIDRQEGVRTVKVMDETFHGSPGSGHTSRTFRDEQVVVYQDTYWQFLKCKFCGHRWRERRQKTYRP